MKTVISILMIIQLISSELKFREKLKHQHGFVFSKLRIDKLNDVNMEEQRLKKKLVTDGRLNDNEFIKG